jgi:hypothetical protein
MDKFDMTDMGPALKYLGWHVTRKEEEGKYVAITGTKYP